MNKYEIYYNRFHGDTHLAWTVKENDRMGYYERVHISVPILTAESTGGADSASMYCYGEAVMMDGALHIFNPYEVLPSFVLHTRINFQAEYSGLDSPNSCLNAKYFASYPHEVSYKFNGRGFRDDEWPTDMNELKTATWCIGDSFTVGLGSPYKHIWPQVLQDKTGIRTINVSLDGASNQFIARKAIELIQTIEPKNLVIMWSYYHRREYEYPGMIDEDRRVYDTGTTDGEDFLHFVDCVNSLPKNTNTNIVHSIIPGDFHNGHNMNLYPTYNALFELPKFIGIVEQLDFARDSHHFDIKTSNWVVDKVIPLLV